VCLPFCRTNSNIPIFDIVNFPVLGPHEVVELDEEMGHMIEALHEVEADFENLVRTHSRMLERQVPRWQMAIFGW